MAIGPPDKTIIQIWKERFWKFVLLVIVTLLYILISGNILMPNREVGIIITPLVVFLYWRIISKVITGKQFSIQISLGPKKLEEVSNVLFTVLFALNLVVYLYNLVSWYQTVS